MRIKFAVFGALAVLLLSGGFFATKKPGSEADHQLIEAARAGDLEGVNRALSSGAQPSYRIERSFYDRLTGDKFDYDEGMTALHYAAQLGKVDIVRTLLDKKANINAQNSSGATPLMLAAGQNKIECVKLLFEKGADLTIKNRDGKQAKDFAKMRNRVESYAMECLFAEKLGGPMPPKPSPPNN